MNFFTGIFRTYYRAYQRFEDCVKTYRGYCPLEYRVELEGIEDLYGYICGEGFEGKFYNIC